MQVELARSQERIAELQYAVPAREAGQTEREKTRAEQEKTLAHGRTDRLRILAVTLAWAAITGLSFWKADGLGEALAHTSWLTAVYLVSVSKFEGLAAVVDKLLAKTGAGR